MSSLPHISLEAHGAAVTLYVHGPLDRHALAPIVVALRELPDRVRALRLDLSALWAFDGPAIDAVLDLVEAWRSSRPTVTRIVPLLPWGSSSRSSASPTCPPIMPTCRTVRGGRDAFVATP